MKSRSKDNVRGIDVSEWQGTINWKKVKQAGILFVYLKVSEGKTWVDSCFEKNVQEAKAEGLLVGGYHFARFHDENEAKEEALHFVTCMKGHPFDLPPVIDMETSQGLSKNTLSRAVLAFRKCLTAEWDLPLMIYTSPYFAREHLSEALYDLPLWIAHYGVNQPAETGIWKEWQVFQHDDKGKIPGIEGGVDLDEWDHQAFCQLSMSDKSLKGNMNRTAFLVIKSGDTFWQLEQAHGWRHGLLEMLNPNLDPRRLQIGQKVKIPN